MARFGFVGPTYSSQSVLADCQRCMNWYPEPIESQQGNSAVALYPTPGLSLFAATANPNRGGTEVNGRVFFVGGTYLWELTAAGVSTNLGNVGNDGNQITMATNGTAGNQLCICSAGQLYIFDLKKNTLKDVGPLQGTPSMVEFCDGYFVATLANSNKFQVSALEDGTTWNAASVQQISVFPENIGGMKQMYRQLWFFGLDGHAQVYYNSGQSAVTPFDVISGAYMEEGIHAPNSMSVVDNTIFWIGGNQNGNGIAWRANGYTPMRISNYSVETAWSQYPQKTSDCVSYAYRDQGHTFWVCRFPSANNGLGATWVYDVATSMWHERGFWSQQGPTGYSAHLSTCHVFAFNKHLVGDWNSGNVYAMDVNTYQDNGQAIRRFRRAPHISNEQQWIYYDDLQVYLEVGDGPIPPLLDGAGNARGPQAMLRWSNDGARTWGNEHWMDAGQVGEYEARVRMLRMGRARDRVYELAVTDPIPWRVIDAFLYASPGFQRPTERMSKQMAKMA